MRLLFIRHADPDYSIDSLTPQGFEEAELLAEKLKNECVSLYENDMSNMEVSGIDIVTKKPRTEIIMSNEVRFAILHFFDNICSALEHLINMCSPEIASDISPNGIVLTGGVAKLVGIEDYITKKLAIPCFIPEDPELATVLGGAKLKYSKQLKY